MLTAFTCSTYFLDWIGVAFVICRLGFKVYRNGFIDRIADLALHTS